MFFVLTILQNITMLLQCVAGLQSGHRKWSDNPFYLSLNSYFFPIVSKIET